MIKIRFVSGALGLALVAACAPAGTVPSVASVPAGCQPTGDRVTWSSIRTTPTLVEAILYGSAGLAAGAPGTALLNKPFTPSISGVAAPDSWLGELGSSLAQHTGQPVHTTAPTAEGQSFGLSSGSEGAQIVLYTGIDRLSAGFSVRCDPAVRGTLTAWATTAAGGVSCEYSPEVKLDAFGRQALALCPGLPTAPASDPADAQQFAADGRN